MENKELEDKLTEKGLELEDSINKANELQEELEIANKKNAHLQDQLKETPAQKGGSKKLVKKYKKPEKGKAMFIPNGKVKDSKKMLAAKVKIKLEVGKGIVLPETDAKKLAGLGLGVIK